MIKFGKRAYVLMYQILTGASDCIAVSERDNKFGRIFNFTNLCWRQQAAQKQSGMRMNNYKSSPIQRHRSRLSRQTA